MSTITTTRPTSTNRYAVPWARCSFLLLFFFHLVAATAQTNPIALDNCGQSYIDPQDENNSATSQNRDTLIYAEYFQDGQQLRAFYVDVNAFGGQQPDRVRAYAILPDNSLKLLGSLSFGNCVDCVDGFALAKDGTLLVSGVNNTNTMNMWLQSQGQPPFTLTGNLQTLTGVGRLSGTIPFCAIGYRVEYSVYSDPANSTTEFSTHILCPVAIQSCPVGKEALIDCQLHTINLTATLPSECFNGNVSVKWSNATGWSANGPLASLPLEGNEGWYYLLISDDCCEVVDSVLVENPPFANAGPDVEYCLGDEAALAGSGGAGHFWEFGGAVLNDSILTIAPLQAQDSGQYILHAFNDLGCEDTDTLMLTVHVPPAPQAELPGLCLGDTVVLHVLNDTAYTQLSWLKPSGQPFLPPVIRGLQPADFGDYTIIGTDAYGCEARETVTVTGSPPPAFEYVIEDACDTARVHLFPDTYLYSWGSGQTGSPLVTATGGTFQLTITDAEGCRTLSSIAVPPPDGLDVALDIEQPRCPGDFGAIVFLADSGHPLLFSIDGGQTFSLSPKFRKLLPGHYPTLVMDDVGCVREEVAEIVAPDTMGVSLSLETLEVRPNTPISLTATTVGDIQEYQWLPREIDSGRPTTNFLARNSMDVRLIVRDSRGCIASDGFQLTVVLGDIYAPNAFSPNGDGRNDAFTFFSDNGSGEIIEVLRVFGRWGGLVFEGRELYLNEETQGWDGTLGGKPMPAGVYTYYGIVRFGNGARRMLSGDVSLAR
ncbi:MAG: gliding motility-associated C-terminal domain-containing protein [Lewinellaceae bacterium]|nr:gliding motility-associated C-terminal domain-containing protein [Lewinellaceae bacterium]